MEAKFIESFKEAMEMENIKIDMNDKFRDFENWSSLKELSLLAMMDSEFGVELEMKDFNKLITIGDLLNYIKTHNS